MSISFESTLGQFLDDLDSSQAELLELLETLADEDLSLGARGEWTVGAILYHVWNADAYYCNAVRKLRGMAEPSHHDNVNLPDSPGDAERQIESAHEALIDSVKGVDEETFYRLKDTGHQEYSVKSVLADAARHHREHLKQIRAILDNWNRD